MHRGAAKDHANRLETQLQLSGGQQGSVDLIEATGKADQVRTLPKVGGDQIPHESVDVFAYCRQARDGQLLAVQVSTAVVPL